MVKKNPPSPAEFKQKIANICKKYKNDQEDRHAEMDLYICETMEALGYGEGIAIFRGSPKWYA